MEEYSGGIGQRVADYFVVAGLTETSRPLEEEIQSEGPRKPPKNLAPIIDIAVIIKSQGEKVPSGYTCIETTPSGLPADLNHGSIASPSIFICIKRGYDKPPLTDIGILYEGKERVMHGCEIVSHTPDGHPANVSNRIGMNNQRAYITYRRASDNAPLNSLAVIDICVILMNKNESPPHAFCLINKNLNKGSMVGSDVYLCYKKSAIRANSIVYQADVLSHYPLENHEDFPFPTSVPRFCMPMGATIECWADNREHPLPVFSTFVLTDIAGGKVYGAAVIFYEKYPEEKLSAQQRAALELKPTNKKGSSSSIYNIHVNKSICLLSHWPFFEAFKKFLAFIYRVSISGPRSIPLERHISHFMHEVPFPTPQRPRILMELGHDQLILARPQTSPIPLSGASYCAMLRNLGPEKTLNVLAYLLLENKLVLHSLRPALLTGVAEAVSSMIFPFVWQCPYIPLCPLSLSDVLSAPMSVIVGIDSRYFDMYDPPSDTICIDIDTNTILQADDKKGITWKILPKKAAKRLYSSLSKLHAELIESSIGDGISDELAVDVVPISMDFSMKKKQLQMEMRIQDAFLSFMAMMLKGYSHHLLPITQQPGKRAHDASARFDYPGFLKTRDKASHVFFKQFLKTQMFIKFIEEISFVSENDEKFAFFDDCIEKVDIDSKDDVQLLDLEGQQDSEHTVFVMPPESDGTDSQYHYTEFPLLRPELFGASTQEVRDMVTPTPRLGKQGIASSPFPRRTKQEMRNSQKMAKMQAASPEQWAYYLLGQSYALWFIHLPSYVKATHSKTRALKTSFEELKKMQDRNVPLFDEVCYRVLMQLCGQYRQPVLAVQIFMEMKRRGIKPNAITYGHYNKAVLECQWPESAFNSYHMWVKLRNTLAAVTQFRRGLKNRTNSTTSGATNSASDANSDVLSRDSGDSVEPLSGGEMDGVRGRAGDGVEQGQGHDEPDLIKLIGGATEGVQLTREEKSSTGNSDMGYASMIMDDTTSHDLLTSPDLSPTKLAHQHQRDSQCLEEEDEVDDEGEDVDRRKEGDVDGVVNGELQVTNEKGDKGEEGERRRDEERIEEMEKEEEIELTPLPEYELDSSPEMKEICPDSFAKSKSAPVSEVSTPISRKRLDMSSVLDTQSEDLFDVRDLEDESRRSSSILRRSRSSVSSREAAHLIVDSPNSSMKVNTSLMDSENLEDNAFDDIPIDSQEAIRKRHRSANHYSFSFPLRIKKRTSSGGDAAACLANSLANPDKLMDKDLFGCDAKILESLRTKKGNFAEKGNHSRSLSVGSKPKNKGKKRDEKVDMQPLEPEEREALHDVCQQIEELNVKNEEESLQSKQDLTQDAHITISDKSEVINGGNSNLIELVGEESNSKASSLPNGTHELSPKCNANKQSSEITKIEEGMPIEGSRPIENGTSQTDLYKLESMESLPSDSSSDTKETKESHKVKKTPKRGSGFFSSITNFASPFTPRMSKQSLSRTIQNASTQMVTLRGHATTLASRFGEYTRQLSSPAVARETQSSGNLLDLDEEDGGSDPMDIRGSLSDLDSMNPIDMGIHMPGSQFAGSTQSLNNPHSSDQEDGLNARKQYAMQVFMTSCFRCNSCKSALYDEHIMAGWSADDSNLNTSCTFCASPRVPFLTVTIKDLREGGRQCPISPSQSVESVQSAPFLKQGTETSSLGKGDGEEERNSGGYHSNPSVDNLSLGSEGEGEPKPSLPTRPLPPAPQAGGLVAGLRRDDKREKGGAEDSPSSVRRRTVSECNVAVDLLKELDSTSRPGNGYAGSMRPGTSFSLPRAKPPPPPKNIGSLTPSMGAIASPAGLLADFGSLSSTSLQASSSSFRGSRELLAAPPPRRDISPDPVSVPYLSPLVLRKEIENCIDNEGEECLRQPLFVFNHPIIFWNLIWTFKRLDMPNYLEGALLAAYSENRDSRDGSRYLAADSRYVKVEILWDNLNLYKEDGIPMYLHWTPNAQMIKNVINAPDKPHFSNQFMMQIVKCIRYNNIFLPMTNLLDEYKKQEIPVGEHRSIYRELLFLAFIALGRENVDQDAFDQQYRIAYSKLSDEQKEQMQKNDRPPLRAVQMCRTVFGDLNL